MISELSEMAVRYPRATDHNNVEGLRQVALGQIEKTAKQRPVEPSSGSRRPVAETTDDKGHQTRLEQGRVIFEKYDSSGNIVLRLPPENVNENA